MGGLESGWVDGWVSTCVCTVVTPVMVATIIQQAKVVSIGNDGRTVIALEVTALMRMRIFCMMLLLLMNMMV